VNDPVSKARFEDEMENIKAGKKHEIKSLEDLGLSVVGVEFDSREFKNPKPTPVQTTRKQAIMLDEDFFTEANLKAYGIKEDYVDDILNVEEDVGFGITGFNETKTRSKRLEAFETILNVDKAIDKSYKLTEGRQQIRDSILAGKPSDVITSHIPAKALKDWKNTTRQIEIDRSKAEYGVRTYMMTNPNASRESLLKHITGEQKMIQSNAGSSIISAPPTRMVTPNN
jgi:hypothetical protein